jgi:decaprenylphospho-beta-D-ribofuranose 2-oxidase
MDKERTSLTGWGRTAPSVAEVWSPTSTEELAASVLDAGPRGVVARGLGRSYGDVAQNAGGRVLDTTHVDKLRAIDLETGIITVDAGASLAELMHWLVPLGWFVPVTPGTRYVTVGGAIANDIHGKNHHTAGSWCNHVLAITLATPANGVITVTPDDDPDLFWATAGGLGLTGVILDATIQMKAIETSLLSVDTDRTRDLDDVMALMEEGDDAYPYSVAWIDIMATGRSVGRAILDRGRFAPLDRLPIRKRRKPLAYHGEIRVTAPPLAPPRLVNPFTVRAFNEAWFRKAPKRRHDHLMSIPAFFHPLDGVGEWNRIYGRPGFLQWQMAVPFGAEDTLRTIVHQLSAARCPSAVNVLKRFGAGNPGLLSFPIPGWTLTIDLPAHDAEFSPLFDRLDRTVAEVGGRLYLAKDSRLDPALLRTMYPRLEEWLGIRAKVDPDGVLQSDLSRRLGLSS